MTASFLAGFAAEAAIARRSGWPVGIGGGTTEGARREARRLIAAGATGLVSFGLAGGLDPRLRPGQVIVADAVLVDGVRFAADPALSGRFGGFSGALCLGLDRVAATAAQKRRLFEATGAAVVDMESAAVTGVPFAVVRVVCDPAERDLPPAALAALDGAGRIGAMRIAGSLLRDPRQIGALIRLARDAAAARSALRRVVEAIL